MVSKSASSRPIDVAVIGGGPAGAALSTFLERAGHHCIVFEAEQFPRYHIGESLIPHTYGALERLGLLLKLRASDYPEKYSVRFVSPDAAESTPFYFSETIKGEGARTWQVERSSFDRLCLDHARDAGADPDELFSNGQETEANFEREVNACAPLLERLKSAKRNAKVYGGPEELAYFNRRTSGDGWVAIGDARAFLDPIYSSGLFLALASAELAADAIHQALGVNDVSAARLGAFELRLMAGVDVVRRLIHAFYDLGFSFGEFVKRFPEQCRALIDCLVGDVLKDMSAFKASLEQMTPPPPALMDVEVR